MQYRLDIETAQQTGHAADRLSELPSVIKTSCHLEILEREYGRDTEFLASHRRLYRRTIARMSARLLRLQLSAGDFAAARTRARRQGAPFHVRLFLDLPDDWGRAAIAGFRRARKTARRLSGA